MTQALRRTKPQAEVVPFPLDPKVKAAREIYKGNRAHIEVLMPALRAVVSPPSSSQPMARAPAAELPYLQVELLLQQAAALLDSVLSAQSAYRDIQVEQLNLSLDLDELEQLQTIHDDEVAAGVFNVPAWSAQASVNSDTAAEGAQSGLSTWVQQQAPLQKVNAIWTAENNAKPFMQWDANKVQDHTPKVGLPLAAWTLSSDESSKIVNGQPATAATSVAAVLSARASDYGFNYIQKQLDAQTAPVAARLPYLSKYAAYMVSDAGFRERRRVVAHAKLTAKLAAFAAPDGVLNYARRLASIAGIARASLAEAEVRLRAARRGARQVFGLELTQLPAPPAADPANPLPIDYLSALAQWTQAASQAVTGATRSDQTIVHRVSLKALMGHHYDAQRRSGIWAFELKPEHFQGLSILRLRGVSAWVKVGCEIPPGLTFNPPRQATALNAEGLSYPVEQEIGAVWLGRPDLWGKPSMGHDIAGAGVLFNASPLGAWSVRINQPAFRDELHDIILEFYLVARYRTSAP